MSTAINSAATAGVVLRDVPWELYAQLRDEPQNERIYMTYDRGALELTTRSSDRRRWLLARLIGILTLELGIPVRSAGATTCRRKDLQVGLEPDDCYYFLHEPCVRGKDHLDLAFDPPPDVAIVMDVSRSVLNTLGIYANLGVTEIWRFQGNDLLTYYLADTGLYVPAARSLNLPVLPLAELKRFIEMPLTIGETTLLTMFRDWVCENLVH